MKLRLLLVSALALAFMVPAALANGPGEDATGGGEATVKSEDQQSAAPKGEKADHSKKTKKAKKRAKNKKHAMRDLCRPRVGVVVRGELVSVDAEAGVFTVMVEKANRHGKRFLKAEATFKLVKKGKVRMQGKATLAHLEKALAEKPGYRVKVMGRACKSEIVDDNETPDLYAKHVKAKAPVADVPKAEDSTNDESGDNNNDEVAS